MQLEIKLNISNLVYLPDVYYWESFWIGSQHTHTHTSTRVCKSIRWEKLVICNKMYTQFEENKTKNLICLMTIQCFFFSVHFVVKRRISTEKTKLTSRQFFAKKKTFFMFMMRWVVQYTFYVEYNNNEKIIKIRRKKTWYFS